MTQAHRESNTTITLEIWRELMKRRDLQEGQEVIVRVNPEIFGSFQQDDQRMFEEVEQALRIHLVFKPDENLRHEQFDVMAV